MVLYMRWTTVRVRHEELLVTYTRIFHFIEYVTAIELPGKKIKNLMTYVDLKFY